MKWLIYCILLNLVSVNLGCVSHVPLRDSQNPKYKYHVCTTVKKGCKYAISQTHITNI
jgi:hypothetical protein